MLKTASLQRRNEPGRINNRKATTILLVKARFLAAFFLKNFDPAIKAASVPPRDDVDLSPCPGRSALIVSRQLGAWRAATMAITGSGGSGLPKTGALEGRTNATQGSKTV